ncbi:Conserved_hypothetical protein [Hexamita inflata]|uniref:Uncharacterized protein n=1 Tax=Hexamita inflata TaxID=28002 RepID=A0AA86U912_9EUKA|nr:Conserved hypothetical protein [Hexamita inflata]
MLGYVAHLDIIMLTNQMMNLENYIFNQFKENSVFNTIQERLDDINTVFYDPKLFMFPSTYKNIQKLKDFNISQEYSRISALNKLNFYLNPQYNFNESVKQQAKSLIDSLNADKPDLQNFFQVQFDFLNQSINHYSQFFDKVQANLTPAFLDAQKYPTENEENVFQYAVHGKKSAQYDLHFTSPVPLQKLSKDVVFLINDFQDAHAVLKTLHETASVYDRIWFFQVAGETTFINIIREICGRRYLSLQAALNFYRDISGYIQNASVDVRYVSNKVLSEIVRQVVAETEGARYNVQSGQQIKSAKFEIVLFVFGRYNIIQNAFNQYEDGNIHLFFVDVADQTDEQFVQTQEDAYHIEFQDQADYLQLKLPDIVKQLNALYVSTDDELGSVNDSVVVARALYEDGEYVGMLLVKPNVFQSFSDVIMNSLDGLSGTTLKIRLMEQQHSILNPFFQYMPSVQYQVDKHTTLLQTTPSQVNNFAQIQFNDVISTKIVKVVGISNSSINSYTESQFGIYQMQTSRKEFTINVAISSGALTTRNRYQSSNINCIPYQMYNIAPKYVNITHLRQINSKPYQRTSNQCLVIVLGECLIQTNEELTNMVKQQVVSQFNSVQNILCSSPFTSTKFKLQLDLDNLLTNLQTIEEFGDIQIIQDDYNTLKNALLSVDQVLINKLRYKYMNLIPVKQKQFQNLDSCVMIVENNKYTSVHKDQSLRNKKVISANIMYALYIKSEEILHFSRQIPYLESLLSNPQIKNIYLGHSWLSDENLFYSNLLEQQIPIINQGERLVVNKICLEVARLFNNHYFMFSTNQQNNEKVQNEHLKSNIDGTNGKFRFSVINGVTYLTKPILSKNKSLVGTQQVQGYLTLELNLKYGSDLFNKFLRVTNTKYFIMDGTGSVIYQNQEEQFYYGIKQLLIQYGYLTETKTYTTSQNFQYTCTKNNNFWDTAFQRSKNGEFTIVVTKNISKFANILSESDVSETPVYLRTLIFDAKSEYFSGGHIIVKEFSILNEFIVCLQDLEKTTKTEQVWQEQVAQQQLQYMQNIPTNLQVLDSIYPNLTTRSIRIPQIIQRIQQTNKQNIINLDAKQVYIPLVAIILIVIYLRLLNQKKTNQNYTYICNFPSYIESISISQQLMLSTSETQDNTELIPNTFEFSTKLNKIQHYFIGNQIQYVFEVDWKLYQFENQNEILTQIANCSILQLLESVPKYYNYKSFVIFCSQQTYSNFIATQKNLLSCITYVKQNFNSNVTLNLYKKEFYIPTRKYITVNDKNKSKLASKIQTLINSRIPSENQSHIQSQCQSRQDFVEYLDDIPKWFDDTTKFFTRCAGTPPIPMVADFQPNLSIKQIPVDQLCKMSLE